MSLAYQCFRLTLANNNDHAEAYNNLGVLELRKGHIDLVSIHISFKNAFKIKKNNKIEKINK
jgi:hypothetical protein